MTPKRDRVANNLMSTRGAAVLDCELVVDDIPPTF